MEENKKNDNAEDDENMARGEQPPLDPVSVAPPPEDSELKSRSLMPPPSAPKKQEQQQVQEEASQHMVTLKPKFLPNLKGLMFPKMVYEQAKRLVITPLLAYPHDPVAALKLRGARCSSFDLPKDMFPQGAPIWKITFLPQELLPMGFDAGGVFGTGVLARKFYPTDLLSADHKGQTPPLFIGHRSSSYILPKGVNAQAKGNGKGKGQGQIQVLTKHIQPLTPAPPPGPALVRSILKPTAAVTAEMNRLLVLHNVSVLEMVIMPAFRKPPSRYPMVVPTQTQYNMYAPDMSKVIFAMQDISLFVASIISTIHQPNVPEVAMATMDNEPCPRFELPAAIFPADTNRMGPRFLPQRFLPDFCDAGCVFPPGSLPDSVFQGALRNQYDLVQHHYTMTPPLFVGRRKPQLEQEQESGNCEAVQVYKIDSIAIQLKKLALKNMVATKQTPGTSVPLPESTKRSNDFKLAVAGDKPKGFVLIESDHVPRGAIPTDFFGAFLMGCFFKIMPETSCLYAFSSEEDYEEEDDEEEDDEEQDMQDAKEKPQTGPKEDKASQATETKEAGKIEAPKADVDNTAAEKAEVEKLVTEEVQVDIPDTDTDGVKIEVIDTLIDKAQAKVLDTTDVDKALAEEVLNTDAETEVDSEDYTTDEYIAEECDSDGYLAEEIDYKEYVKCKLQEYDSEQTESEEPLPQQVVKPKLDNSIPQPVVQKTNQNINDNDTGNAGSSNNCPPLCPGCSKVYSYFTVDSNLDDIAEAAGNIDTARFEVIVHPSELPGMDVNRAVEQFRQVLKCRNEIRAKMTGMINAHVAKLEEDNKLTTASSGPPVVPKRVIRKPCSQCGKHH